jgi:hypothetical protein
MKKFIAAFFMATILLTACKSSKETSSNTTPELSLNGKAVSTIEQWIIAGNMVKCGDADVSDCYQVKKFGSAGYEKMNVVIEGFNYEPGYKYQIEIKVIPSKKAPTKYLFVKETVKIVSN